MAEKLYPTALIVDDFRDSRSVLRRMLEARGFWVEEVSNGEEAVAAARRGCPNLILMDLNMPLMDGLEATQRIRELKDKCAGAVIVAVTAFDTYGMRDAALEAGCDEYIVKPVVFDELNRIVSDLLPEVPP